MSEASIFALALYAWGVLVTAFIAANLKEAPKGRLFLLLLGSILMGLLWPFSLLAHAADLHADRAKEPTP